ncbi:photosynthetic complex putative assembly protein PuhB [Blastochloris sulfoviridis]|uniref:PH domain-containing protein n=1 Tax=Blastochloris sulfoviridis TaxID=50712 RepID=A0A5M6I5F6_9HYPH|nr:photosynthetic complex putative assembly protein PuhB [Blastochloris sulfoviridis]KAA5603067.1 PH domain-containing protein [Blastochloris sulfoviridis]
MSHHDDEFQPYVKGLPGPLPAGEDMLWQGEPRWWRFAITALHVRKVAIYFLLLVLWRLANGISAEETLPEITAGVTWLITAGAGVVGIILVGARWICGTSVYTITNKRVVLQFGVVLEMTFNLPFSSINHAALKTYPDGTGDIPLSLVEGSGKRLGYLVLWPHVRPWRFERPEPMMRCVPDARKVSEILANAIAADTAIRAAEAANGATGEAAANEADSGSEAVGTTAAGQAAPLTAATS